MSGVWCLVVYGVWRLVVVVVVIVVIVVIVVTSSSLSVVAGVLDAAVAVIIVKRRRQGRLVVGPLGVRALGGQDSARLGSFPVYLMQFAWDRFPFTCARLGSFPVFYICTLGIVSR